MSERYNKLYQRMVEMLGKLDPDELDRRPERRAAIDEFPAGTKASMWVDIDATIADTNTTNRSYIVNTASAAGLLAPPGSGVYAASKHAVVAITECLHHELRGQNAPIGVSVLCPAFVDTGISNSERNRPAELADSNPEAEQYSDRIRQAIKSGKLSAADIARITIDAVKDGRFYILTHPNVKIAVEIRMNDILLDRQPTNTSQR